MPVTRADLIEAQNAAVAALDGVVLSAALAKTDALLTAKRSGTQPITQESVWSQFEDLCGMTKESVPELCRLQAAMRPEVIEVIRTAAIPDHENVRVARTATVTYHEAVMVLAEAFIMPICWPKMYPLVGSFPEIAEYCQYFSSEAVREFRAGVEREYALAVRVIEKRAATEDVEVGQIAPTTETERRIVAALQAGVYLRGDKLAERVHREYTGSFKELLARMKKDGIISNDRARGYHLPASTT